MYPARECMFATDERPVEMRWQGRGAGESLQKQIVPRFASLHLLATYTLKTDRCVCSLTRSRQVWSGGCERATRSVCCVLRAACGVCAVVRASGVAGRCNPPIRRFILTLLRSPRPLNASESPRSCLKISTNDVPRWRMYASESGCLISKSGSGSRSTFAAASLKPSGELRGESKQKWPPLVSCHFELAIWMHRNRCLSTLWTSYLTSPNVHRLTARSHRCPRAWKRTKKWYVHCGSHFEFFSLVVCARSLAVVHSSSEDHL